MGMWPATVQRGAVCLRPLGYRDRQAWQAVRARNMDWVRPWDATMPPGANDAATTFRGMVRSPGPGPPCRSLSTWTAGSAGR